MDREGREEGRRRERKRESDRERETETEDEWKCNSCWTLRGNLKERGGNLHLGTQILNNF